MGDRALAEEQMVIFTLAGESYGVDIAAVHGIIRMQRVTKVPQAPRFVMGVTNLRGSVVPVIDLHERFGLPIMERSNGTRIVVVEIGGQSTGMVVDAVTGVMSVSTEDVEPPSPLVTTIDSDYLRGIAKADGKLIIMLAIDRVVSVASMTAILPHASQGHGHAA